MTSAIERHQDAVRLAAAQAGVLSMEQLTGLLGWSSDNVRTQVRAGRWQTIHRGVYAVTTGELTIEAQWWAAHLRCGPASAIAGHSALQAWKLVPVRQTEPIEVVVPANASGRTPGIAIRRAATSPPVRSPKALPPCQSAPHALLDVADRLPAAAVMELVSSCCQWGRVTPAQLERAMRGRRTKHRKLLTEVLAEVSTGSTSMLEIPGTRRILRAHGLPEGEGQVREGSGRKSVVRDRVIGRLIIEFDGRLGHAGPHGRLRDLNRDNLALVSGRPTLRFGWTDVHESACEAADQVALVLRQLGANPALEPCSDHCRSELVGPAGGPGRRNGVR